jgi:hypothetical protein
MVAGWLLSVLVVTTATRNCEWGKYLSRGGLGREGAGGDISHRHRFRHLGQVTAFGSRLLSSIPVRRAPCVRLCFAVSRAEFGSVEGGTEEFFEVRPDFDSNSEMRFLNSATTPEAGRSRPATAQPLPPGQCSDRYRPHELVHELARKVVDAQPAGEKT